MPSFIAVFMGMYDGAEEFLIDRNIDIKKGFNNRTSYTDDDVSYFNYIQTEVGFDVK